MRDELDARKEGIYNINRIYIYRAFWVKSLMKKKKITNLNGMFCSGIAFSPSLNHSDHNYFLF